MEILAAFDLAGSQRAAAELAGCSHHTVAAHIAGRDAGRPVGVPGRRPQVTDPFVDKIEEWVEASRGRIRADRVHDKLLGLGYRGSERSTRRAVAEVKKAYRLGHARVHRPWLSEPGMWLQYDFGDGPRIAGVATVLFVAWLVWSRFRVVIALRDKTQPSVIAALDRTFRLLGGVPTYLLTDNEKTVTVDQVAGVPVRNAGAVSFGRHYGVSVLTCAPADPASKGGVEASVKISKADLVPTETNLAGEYSSFAELETSCAEFMDVVNSRVHRVTRRVPTEMLAEERARLHRVPDEPHTVVFGLSRRVPPNTPMVAFEHGQYSVPERLLGERVWVRAHGIGAGERIVIVHADRRGPTEVARHRRATPGTPSIDDDHFGGPPAKRPGEYSVHPKTAAEWAFLAIGDGAQVWLAEAAAAGTSRIRAKMEAAVTMAKVAGNARVDWALGHAAVDSRFGYQDLASILNAHPAPTPRKPRARPPPPGEPPKPGRCLRAPPAGPRSTAATAGIERWRQPGAERRRHLAGGEPVTRPDQVIVDRFDLANASFWLDQMAGWLAQPGHGDRLAADLWPGVVEVGPPLRVIVGRAAAALRSALNSPEVR